MTTTPANVAKPLSYYHREMHRQMIEVARSVRHDGARHARLLDLARASRSYFAHYRSVGN
jgi:hypothetical protein